MAKARVKNVVVSGDLVLDHHIYEGRRQHYGDGVSPGVRIKKEEGGAAVVHNLLEFLLRKKGGGKPAAWKVQQAVKLPAVAPTDKTSDASQTAYAFWRLFGNNTKDDRDTKKFWRVSEAMGFGAILKNAPRNPLMPDMHLPSAQDVIAISDGGMGFRQTPACWANLQFANAKWIVLKTSAPWFKGELWKELTEKHGDRLVVVASASELRKSPARVSSGLSWEETIENLVCDLNGSLKPLRKCRHLLAAFGSEGGLWFDFSKDDGAADSMDPASRVRFVYDAASIEGDHDHAVEGKVFGLLSCLAAATVWQMTLDDASPNLVAALEGGLSAMRDLREEGHGAADSAPDGFPAERLAEVIKRTKHRYSIAGFSIEGPQQSCPPPADSDPPAQTWSLVQESQAPNSPQSALARLVVLRGPTALENLPHLKIGALLSVDRREIESLHTLSQLIRHYDQDDDAGEKPLSIGVFGPPGSGKSFAVKQLAKNLVDNAGWKEFNLSQFDAPDDLIGAFHQIRDLVLQGKLPVAFFDEFDSQRYRWLQYLLAPMQDGQFQEGQLTHPLGKCIFVLAGGTSWTFDTFGPPAPKIDANKKQIKESKEYREFRLAKGPDFKSRLDGYLNVIGPNRRQIPILDGNPTKVSAFVSGHYFTEDEQDRHYAIRRALMIRHQFNCKHHQKIEVDEGLLNALLNVSDFRHGSRSLGKILQPLKTALPGEVHRSLLAPREQLDMHTDAKGFLNWMEQAPVQPELQPMTGEQVERIAAAVHETWRRLGSEEGWLTKEDDKDYQALVDSEDPFEQHKAAANVAAAERMPKILALVGLVIEDQPMTEQERQDARQHIEYHLELLAEAEHERWMDWHLELGWRRGSKKDVDEKLHPCLVDYQSLNDEDKNKDRTQVRNYPDFVHKAGMKIGFA